MINTKRHENKICYVTSLMKTIVHPLLSHLLAHFLVFLWKQAKDSMRSMLFGSMFGIKLRGCFFVHISLKFRLAYLGFVMFKIKNNSKY